MFSSVRYCRKSDITFSVVLVSSLIGVLMISVSSILHGAGATQVVWKSRSVFSSLVEHTLPVGAIKVLTINEGLWSDVFFFAQNSVSCVRVNRYVFQLFSLSLSIVLLKLFCAVLYDALFSSDFSFLSLR